MEEREEVLLPVAVRRSKTPEIKFTTISRKVVGKNVHATIPKSNMGYDQYTVPDDCSCRTYFCCFPLALANTFPWPFVPILSHFFEKKETQNHPQCLSGLSRALFPTTFLEIAVYVATKTSRIPRNLNFLGETAFWGGIFCLEYPSRRSEKVNFHFLNYRLSFRKLQILISQTTDFHFANYRFTFRKLQIFISQTTDFHFVSFHFVSQAKVSLMNTLSETRVSGVTGKEWCVCVCVGKGGGGYLRMHKQGGD